MKWTILLSAALIFPYAQMGEYAAKLLLAMIENRESEFTYQEFKCRLIQRETTL